jgi:hypothetical protein
MWPRARRGGTRAAKFPHGRERSCWTAVSLSIHRPALVDGKAVKCSKPAVGLRHENPAKRESPLDHGRADLYFSWCVAKRGRDISRVRFIPAVVGRFGSSFSAETGKPGQIGYALRRLEDQTLAGVAELVDALDLGSSDASRGGSSPSARTTPGPGKAERRIEGGLAEGVIRQRRAKSDVSDFAYV